MSDGNEKDPSFRWDDGLVEPHPPLLGISRSDAPASASAAVAITASASGAQNGEWSEGERLPRPPARVPIAPSARRPTQKISDSTSLGRRAAELAEILAAHHRWHLHHPILPEPLAQARHHPGV